MPLRVQKEAVVVANDAIGHERRDSAFLDELDLGRVQHAEIVGSNGRRCRRIAMRAARDY